MEAGNVIVIGGGAAGFFSAVNIAEMYPECKVTLLEKSGKLLSKVRVSGGGRCNVTHACFDNRQLVKNYPRGEKELLNVFSRFSTTDTIEWFEKRGVKLKTEEDGRMFPVTDSSETIVRCLLQEAEKNNVKILQNVSIEKIIKDNHEFTLRAAGGGTFTCDRLVIATGGNPKEDAYRWLSELGHTVIKPVPSLFTFNIADKTLTALMGVSVPEAKVKIAGTGLETQGPLLITHWGLSGPAVLKTSAWGAKQLNDKNYEFTVLVSWLPKFNEEKLKIEFENERMENGAKMVIPNCPFELPKRLWEYLCLKAGISSAARWADLSKKNANVLIASLVNDEYKVSGKTTFKEEFVTCGGIDLKEIDMARMESKLVPGLFFSGEVINVDGITGGFNFQNAWSTAWIASLGIFSKNRK
ncbi:MAG: NAD(P)/FAD-dependent oxidoreductase [Bacteroidia bacterium]